MRSLGIALNIVLAWASFASWTVVLGACMLADVLFGRKRRFSARAMTWIWGRMQFWTSPLWSVERRGVDRVGPGPYVVVSNHQSTVDVPCICGVCPIRVAARQGIFDVPLLGWFMRWSKQVHAERFFEDGAACLSDGVSLLVFPEGTRSLDGNIGRFHLGAFKLAMDTATPILPVVIDGSRHMLPKGRLVPANPRVHVVIGVLEPVDPAGFASVRDLKQHVHRAMVAEWEQLWT